MIEGVLNVPMYQLFDREDCDGRTFLRLLMERSGDGRKITVRELADAAGVSRSLIGNLLTGKSNQLPYEPAYRSAELCGVDFDVLWVQVGRTLRARDAAQDGGHS